MNACGTVDADALIRSLVGMADCQVATLGGDGWQALAASGMFAAVLTGLLTLAIAREGYRLLAGRGAIVPADAVMLLLRIGIVIALSTSWAAYDRVIYRVAMEGPAEIAAIVFPAAGVDTGSLVDRLQNAYDAIDTVPKASDKPAATPAPPAQGSERPPSEAAASSGAGLPGSGRHAAAGMLAVVGAGSWIAARLVLGLLLAVGPLAMVAWLFDASAGLFVGWLRALIGATLACLAIPLVLAVELQALAGPVTAAARAGSADIPGVAPILWIFTLVLIALVFAVQRMAGGLRLPDRRVVMPTQRAGGASSTEATPATAAAAPRAVAPPPAQMLVPARAREIARAAQVRVTAHATAAAVTVRSAGSASPALAAPADTGSVRGTQLIDSARRSAAGRRTVSGKRVDMRS